MGPGRFAFARTGRRGGRRRRAFSLVELLVVVTIIALLVSLVAPSFWRVKRRSRVVICASHLRDISTGLDAYASANRLKLMPCRFAGSASDDDLSPLYPDFVGDIDVFRCPASQYDHPRTGEHIQWKTSVTSKGEFAQLSYEYPGECLLQTTRVVEADMALLAYDDDGRGVNVRTDVDAHSPDGGNMSYFDGSARWVEAKDWYYAVWDGIYAWYRPPRRAARP